MNRTLLKKYIVLEICGAIVLLLLVGTGLKLFLSIKQYTKEKNDLQAAMDRLQQLYHRHPYPSTENVKRESENFKDILDSYNELNEMLRARQVEPQMTEAADFMPLLEKTLRRLRSQLESAHIAFPAKFTFGFEKYAGGKLPASRDIPRLVQQLKIIDNLCQALCEADITELISISREEFESSGRSAEPVAGRAGRGAPSPEAPAFSRQDEQLGEPLLYTTQHFKMGVRANETAVFDLLNVLAKLPTFTVVTSVEMMNRRPTLQEGGGTIAPKGSAATAAAEPLSRDQRMMLGKEEIELKLEVDVYQFAPSMDFTEGAKKGNRKSNQ